MDLKLILWVLIEIGNGIVEVLHKSGGYYQMTVKVTAQSPKILAWDVETSYLLTAVFQRFLTNAIPFSSVTQDWFMFCAAVQWLHKDKIQLISILDDKKRFDKD